MPSGSEASGRQGGGDPAVIADRPFPHPALSAAAVSTASGRDDKVVVGGGSAAYARDDKGASK